MVFNHFLEVEVDDVIKNWRPLWGGWILDESHGFVNHLRGCQPHPEHREKATKDSRHSWMEIKIKMESDGEDEGEGEDESDVEQEGEVEDRAGCGHHRSRLY